MSHCHHHHRHYSIWWSFVVALLIASYWTTIVAVGLLIVAGFGIRDLIIRRRTQQRSRQTAYWEWVAEQRRRQTSWLTDADRDWLRWHGWNGR